MLYQYLSIGDFTENHQLQSPMIGKIYHFIIGKIPIIKCNPHHILYLGCIGKCSVAMGSVFDWKVMEVLGMVQQAMFDYERVSPTYRDVQY